MAFLLLLTGLVTSCSSEEPLPGKAVRIIDGDTAVIVAAGRQITCRLYGIDAPEKGGWGRKGQPNAREAEQALKSLIDEQSVELVLTGEKTYNRPVCLIRKDGQDINLEMVRRGFAWAYRKHLTSPYASAYLDAEKDARARRSGIWQDANPLPPWEFKRRFWKE
ncbi:MAG: thermonuclease family protein [Nitrospiraceae bacterium]|nr:MAG: thermonuclease family protein [Nitrospiraceae bacterium]